MSQRLMFLGLVALSICACSTTTFETKWRNPNARPIRLAGQKVVGLFMSSNPSLRRSAEDAMVRELNARGAQGVPGYTVLDDSEVRDRDAAKRKLESLGFAGAVVMRIIGSHDDATSPGPTSPSRVTATSGAATGAMAGRPSTSRGISPSIES